MYEPKHPLPKELLMSESAFPYPPFVKPGHNDFEQGEQGMTLRDYFAGQVAATIWSEMCQTFREVLDGDVPQLDECAVDSYRLADAMLKARETN